MPTIHALPYGFRASIPSIFALVIIDMQRNFVEPGGFGAALGNNVGLFDAGSFPPLPNCWQRFAAWG